MKRRTPSFDADCGDGKICSAIFSPDRTWRYELRRVWDPTRPLVAFVGLNPTGGADETHDDRTIRRCIGFAERWGYGGLIVLNAFAARSTDPLVMKAAQDPIGPENDAHLLMAAREASEIVVAWGNHARFAGRSKHIIAMLGEVSALGVTKLGEPWHPLYVRGDTQRIPYRVPS